MVSSNDMPQPVFRSIWSLALRYSFFAVLATLLNLGAQRVVLALIEGAIGFALAIFVGTLAGLLLKYVLDKRWIFYDRQTTGLAGQGRQFSAYMLMGVVTTLIFWGTETAFWLVWQTHMMREVGAVLGLAVGYIVKYQLDKLYVFPQAGLVA